MCDASAKKLTQLSHKLSAVLRHKAIAVGLKLDQDCWCRITDLLRLQEFKNATQTQIQDVVRTSESKDGPRFEIKAQGGDLWIRATRKHTIGVAATPNSCSHEAVPQTHDTHKKGTGDLSASGGTQRTNRWQSSSSSATSFVTVNRGRELRWDEHPSSNSNAKCTLGKMLQGVNSTQPLGAFESLAHADDESSELFGGSPERDLEHTCKTDPSNHTKLRPRVPCRTARQAWAPDAQTSNDNRYIPLRQGDRIRQKEVQDGWAFGDVLDEHDMVLRSGWYPSSCAWVLKEVIADWDSSEYGDEYMPLVRGNRFWHNGRIEDGWEFGEIIDEHEHPMRSGWYPPAYAKDADDFARPLVTHVQSPESELQERHQEDPGVSVASDVATAPSESKSHINKTSKKNKRSKKKGKQQIEHHSQQDDSHVESVIDSVGAAVEKGCELEKKCSVQDAVIKALREDNQQKASMVKALQDEREREMQVLRQQVALLQSQLKPGADTAVATSAKTSKNSSTAAFSCSSGLASGSSSPPVIAAERRTKQLEAATKRAVNAPAAERGGGSGVSAETMKEMQRRAAADVERARLEEMAHRRGGDAGPAGMFARAKLASPEDLRKYIQVFGDVETRMVEEAKLNSLRELKKSKSDLNIDVSSSDEDPDMLEAKRRSMNFNVRDEGKRKFDVGEWVEVCKGTGKKESELIGIQGRVTGIIPPNMFSDETCTVQCDDGQLRTVSMKSLRRTATASGSQSATCVD